MRSLFHNSIFIHVTIIWVMFGQPHCWGKYVTSLSLLGDSLTGDNLVLWLSNAYWKWLLLSEFQENVKWYQHSSLQWNLECDWLVGFYHFSSSPINKQKFPRTLENVIENVSFWSCHDTWQPVLLQVYNLSFTEGMPKDIQHFLICIRSREDVVVWM